MLTKKIQSYILEAIASKGVRPTLAYAYYLADKKVLVSTDTFRLHEVKGIDLGPTDLILNSKGELIPTPQGYAFPQYESFFPTEGATITAPLRVDNVKTAFNIFTHATEHTQCILDSGYIKHAPGDTIKNISEFTFRTPLYDTSIHATHLPLVSFNIEYLYSHTRYIDKPHLTTITIKSALSPIVFQSTIDGYQVRTLIMPLKM